MSIITLILHACTFIAEMMQMQVIVFSINSHLVMYICISIQHLMYDCLYGYNTVKF